MKKNKIIKTTNSSPIAEYVELSSDLIDITDIMENYSTTFTDLAKHDTKESNPKDNIGSKKVGLNFVSSFVMMEMALGMTEGACKYGAHNYRVAGVRASVYYSAAMRHLMAWHEGEDIDPESGLSHITKALSCLSVLRDSMHVGNWVDDRPPKLKDGWIAELNKKTEEIINRYPNPVKPFTEK